MQNDVFKIRIKVANMSDYSKPLGSRVYKIVINKKVIQIYTNLDLQERANLKTLRFPVKGNVGYDTLHCTSYFPNFGISKK